MLREGPKDNASAMIWRNDIQKKSPTLMYYELIMRYEILISHFRQCSQREIFSSICGGLVGIHTVLLFPWNILTTHRGCLSTSDT